MRFKTEAERPWRPALLPAPLAKRDRCRGGRMSREFDDRERNCGALWIGLGWSHLVTTSGSKWSLLATPHWSPLVTFGGKCSLLLGCGCEREDCRRACRVSVLA